MNTRRFLHAALVLLGLLTLRLGVAASPPWAGSPDWAGEPAGRPTLNYHALYVFGDSLSDTGNDLLLTQEIGVIPPVPPSTDPHRTYWEGRFSNGPVAAEYLWRELSRKGELITPSLAVTDFAQKMALSFAYGGSGSGEKVRNPGNFEVYGTLSQVEFFREKLQGKQANKHALYMVWTGANDYLFYGVTNPEIVVGNIIAAMQRLYSLGAREFLVPNLPDISRSPLMQVQPMPVQEGMAALVMAHNAILAQALGNLSANLPDVRIFSTDTFTLMNRLLDGREMALGPALEYLAPGVGASMCLFDPNYPNSCPSVDLNAELPPIMFWDVLHPTTDAHRLLGRAMYESLRR